MNLTAASLRFAAQVIADRWAHKES